MKISIFLYLFALGGASASSSYGQNTMLSLKVHNKTLEEVFHVIESQSKYIFFYNDDAINVKKRVDVSVNGATVYEILDQVLDKKESGYKIVDKQVILFKNTNKPDAAELEVEQQKYIVTGSVKSNMGEPLMGVSVVEKGTTNGVLTDIDRSYSISLAKSNTTLIFSYIGFESLEIQTNGKQKIDIVMQEKASDLDEVIVVAYGTQRKGSITGAISTVSSEKLKNVTSPNVSSMLQGKVAGVSIAQNSGKPGEGSAITIRGRGSS